MSEEEQEIWNRAIKVDNHYKSFWFKYIFDGNFDRDERGVLLVILRNTIFADRLWDILPIKELSERSGVSKRKTKEAIKRLEARSIIEADHSRSGASKKKFKGYRLSLHLLVVFSTAEELNDGQLHKD